MSVQTAKLTDEDMIMSLYQELVHSWNHKSAGNFAFLFDENAHLVGFDGSQMNGRAEIEIELSQIFTHHETGSYVSKIREVRFLKPKTALLTAVAGMIPHGETDIKPEITAIQSLVAIKTKNDDWKIALFQNTPAQFHEKPELAAALSAELRKLL